MTEESREVMVACDGMPAYSGVRWLESGACLSRQHLLSNCKANVLPTFFGLCPESLNDCGVGALKSHGLQGQCDRARKQSLD